MKDLVGLKRDFEVKVITKVSIKICIFYKLWGEELHKTTGNRDQNLRSN